MDQHYQQRIEFNKRFNIPTESEIHCLPFFARRKCRKDLVERFRRFVRDQRLRQAGRDAAMDDELLYGMEEFH